MRPHRYTVRFRLAGRYNENTIEKRQRHSLGAKQHQDVSSQEFWEHSLRPFRTVRRMRCPGQGLNASATIAAPRRSVKAVQEAAEEQALFRRG